MNLIANNLWEQDQLRKLKTPEQVRALIERCELGQRAAPSAHKVKEWGRKLVFLDKLLRELSKTP